MDLDSTPAMTPPDGQTSNFDGPMTSAQWEFIRVSAGLIGGATVAVGLRVWARAGVMRHFGLDDYAVVAAWFLSIGFFVCSIHWMQYGFGDHLWNVRTTLLTNYAQWTIPVLTTYCWAPMLSKFSILMLYHRLNPNKPFRLIIYIVMAIIVGYALASTLVISVACRPTDPTKEQCINNLTLIQAVLNISTSGIMLLIPLPVIHRLQFPLSERMIVALVLAGGCFAVAASIIRIITIQNLRGAEDYTWERVRVATWSSIEINVIIMCQCLISLKPLLKQYLPGLLDDGIYPKSEYSRSRLSLPFGMMTRGTTGVVGGGRLSKSWWRSPRKDEIIVTNTYEVQSTYELRTSRTTESMENIMKGKR